MLQLFWLVQIRTNWITISSNTQIIETEEGNVFEFDSVDIRYVRDCISGNRRNDQLGSPLDKRNFWVEIKVWSNGNNIAQNLALREQNELEHTLNTWRNMAINKGFNGIYFVTVSGMRPSQDPEFAQDIGMEGLTAYYYSNTSHTADNGVRYSSYGIVREYYKDKWAEQYAINNNYFPLITPCYDDTMKYRYNGKLITYCRPDRFHTQVNDAKQFVDQNNINPKIIMIKAWNEWPESSVLVPTESQQFGYLEAIKNTFS